MPWFLLAALSVAACNSDESPASPPPAPEAESSSTPAISAKPPKQAEPAEPAASSRAGTSRLQVTPIVPALELPDDPPSSLSAPQAELAVDELFAQVRKWRQGIDGERFDPDAVLGRTGINADVIFRWMRVNTRPLPYLGALKGPVGVIMDGAGNALDRSLLLAELLSRSGREVELANARLTASGREAIEARVLEQLNDGLGGAPVDEAGLELPRVERLAAISGQDPAQLVSYVQEVEQSAAELRREILSQAEIQTAALVETVALERGGESALETALAALEDHWWVVLADEDPPRRLDLYFDQENEDLTDQGLASEAKTYALDKIPAAHYHTVKVSVVADEWFGGQVRSRDALAETFRVADLRLQPMELSFVASDGPQKLSELIDFDPVATSSEEALRDRILSALEQQTAWTPVLRVGETVYSESMIADDGSLSPAQALLGAARAVGSALSALETLGQSPEAASGPRQLSGIRLEVELEAPFWSTTHRRVLFDMADRAEQLASRADLRRQRAARFLSKQTFVIQSSRVEEEFLNALELDELLAKRASMERLVFGTAAGDPDATYQELLELRPPADSAQRLAALRFGSLGAEQQVALVHANVLSSFEEVTLEDPGARVVVGLDILENGVLPLNRDADKSRRAAVYQGVLDTLLEDSLMAFAPNRVNTAREFGGDLAAGQEVAWQVLPPGDRARFFPQAVEAVDFESPSVILASSAEGLGAGASERGFWQIDPRTGRTLGYGPSGRGSVSVEQLIKIINLAWSIRNAAVAGYTCNRMSDLCSFLSCWTGVLGTGGGIFMGSAISGLVWKTSILLLNLSIRPSHC